MDAGGLSISKIDFGGFMEVTGEGGCIGGGGGAGFGGSGPGGNGGCEVPVGGS